MYVVGVLQHGNFLDIFCYFSFILVSSMKIEKSDFFFICTLSVLYKVRVCDMKCLP